MKDKNVAGSRMGSISNGVKKTTLILSVLSFFALASTAFAQGFVPLAPIPGLTEGATADTAGLANFFNNLYKYLIGLAAALAVIEIIWGGLEISTQDSVSKNKDGKDRIYQAIFGLVLVLSPVLVFSIINPSILNLSLNLPKLDTKSTAPVTTTPETRPVLETNSQLQSCTPDTCAAVRTSCRTSTFTTAPGAYYTVSAEVVCVKPGGVVDPNGRTDSWYNGSFGCVDGESLAVKCTISQATSP
jgi:hypothetical protein